jgi:hypothetical protein
VDPDLLDSLNIECLLGLKEGRHQVPVYKGFELPLEVPANCTGHLTLILGRDKPGAPVVVKDCRLQFDRPIMLERVFQLLSGAGRLFKDKELPAVQQLLSWFSDPESIGVALEALPDSLPAFLGRFGDFIPLRLKDLGHLINQIKTATEDVSTRVALNAMRLVPSGDGYMEAHFTGEVQVIGGVSVPFNEVKLPRVVIPLLNHELSRILSESPLASAHLDRRALPDADAQASAFFQMVSSMDGSLDVAGALPALRIDSSGADDSLHTMELGTEGIARARGLFHYRLEGGTVSLRLPDAELRLDDSLTKFALGLTVRAEPSRLLELLRRKDFGDELAAELDLHIKPASRLANLRFNLHNRHPLLVGDSRLHLLLHGLDFSGRFAYRLGDWPGQEEKRDVGLRFAAKFEALTPTGTTGAGSSLTVDLLRGNLSGALHSLPHGYGLKLKGQAEGALSSRHGVPSFPELGLEGEDLLLTSAGDLLFQVELASGRNAGGQLEFDFSDTQATMILAQMQGTLGTLSLNIPKGTRLAARVEEGVLSSTGLGTATLSSSWDMKKKSPVLRKGDQQVEIFVSELLRQEFNLEISPTGGIRITGPAKGLYDASYFNALIHPFSEGAKWVEILRSREAMQKVEQALALLHPGVGRVSEGLRSLAQRLEQVLEDEAIYSPGDLVPAPKLARVLSRIITGGTEAAPEILELVLGVVRAEGLDHPRVRALLERHLPWVGGYEFEVISALRWVGKLLGPRPVEAPPPWRPVVDGPAEQRARTLPGADDLYAMLAIPESPTPVQSAQLARLAPYLSLSQVEWLLTCGPRTFVPEDRLALGRVLELKRRIRSIGEDYGGIGHSPQAVAISFFLGEALQLDREATRVRGAAFPARTFLGPEDAAVLLQAGLGGAWSGRWAQLNLRLLLNKILAMPRDYVLGVLAEMGSFDPRVLSGALMALLELPQQHMREPLDLADALQRAVGVEIPRRAEYMAGGRWARFSYYEALNRTAEQLLEESGEYRAVKRRLQVTDQRRVGVQPFPARDLALEAHRSVRAAEALGKRFLDHAVKANRLAATQAYNQAFADCAALAATHPQAILLPWFKRFWAKNHEALVVRSVLQNVQDDADQVRDWLRLQTGAALPRSEARLLDAVVEGLYARAPDRATLKSDPLVRLLLPPPEGHYDFTVISCMGVVTQGREGHELEAAFGRLHKAHGVHIIRADTATNKPLEYNARRIIEAMEEAVGPFGFLGYSQGCANALMAESILASGTPRERRLLDRLVCRNLLFSAFNGSPHGSSTDRKFLEAMVGLDNFLSHYQARLSQPAIEAAVRVMVMLLDNRLSATGILGMRSVAYEGVMELHRHGRFKDAVPTSLVRAIAEPDRYPEVLQFLYHMLTRLTGNLHHDTQVSLEDAIGHSRWVVSPGATVLRDCDMGALPQRSHHWSPLREDADPIATPFDRKHLVYESPKDRHVFPWIEVNARFGLISRG